MNPGHICPCFFETCAVLSTHSARQGSSLGWESPQIPSELHLRQSPAHPTCSSKHCLSSPTLHCPRQGQVTPRGRVPILPLPSFPSKSLGGEGGISTRIPPTPGKESPRTSLPGTRTPLEHHFPHLPRQRIPPGYLLEQSILLLSGRVSHACPPLPKRCSSPNTFHPSGEPPTRVPPPTPGPQACSHAGFPGAGFPTRAFPPGSPQWPRPGTPLQAGRGRRGCGGSSGSSGGSSDHTGTVTHRVLFLGSPSAFRESRGRYLREGLVQGQGRERGQGWGQGDKGQGEERGWAQGWG